EPHHDVDLLSFTNRGDAEEIFDVQNAETADLDVVAKQIGRRAENEARRTPIAPHDVVGDQAMPAQPEVDGAFAFADAAFAQHEQAEAKQVDEDGVQLRLGRE